MNSLIDAHSHEVGPWASRSAWTRRALAVALALAVAAGLAATAPASAAEDTSEEVSASTHVQAGGDAELCVEASGTDGEQCVDLGRDASGDLAATVAVSSESGDSGAKVDVKGCEDDQAGAVIVFSNTGPDATIQANFDGDATVDGESQDVDEQVGPIGVGPSGEASASVCGSASAEVGGGDGDSGTLLQPVRDLVQSLLP